MENPGHPKANKAVILNGTMRATFIEARSATGTSPTGRIYGRRPVPGSLNTLCNMGGDHIWDDGEEKSRALGWRRRKKRRSGMPV